MRGRARESAKPNKCILCGKEQTSLCKSHSVPKLSLVNIADNGKLLQSSAFLKIETMDLEKGINNSGIFRFICRNCDGTFFQDYENKDNLNMKPSEKMLAEIAVKDFLLQLDKRTLEYELYRLIHIRYGNSKFRHKRF